MSAAGQEEMGHGVERALWMGISLPPSPYIEVRVRGIQAPALHLNGDVRIQQA